MSTKPRVKIYPDNPKAGSVVEIKTLISHVMETGQRKAPDGTTIKRNIISAFTASFAGKKVFSATLHPGISANPYLAFHMRLPASGTLELTWIDDEGQKIVENVEVKAG